jgi:hypothetical protein
MSAIEAKLESLLDLVITDLVDDRERYLDADGTAWEPIGAGGRRHTEHWTLARLHEARCLSRQLVDENPFAANAIENRVSYLIGAGHSYRVDPRPGVERTDPVLTAVTDFLEEFDELNRWPLRQIERQRRFDRDGEAFDRLFTDDAGMTLLRFVDPELVLPPTARGEDAPSGIEFAAGDAESPDLYWIDDEPVPAADVQHRKANVDQACPRGLPLLWPVRRNLRRTGLLLRNMSALVEVQTSIALIRKHRGVSAGGIEAFADAQTTATAFDPVSGQTQRYRQYGPGTILDVPAGREYEFPTLSVQAGGLVEVLRAELRAIAARLVMPEFMLTSDASNAAYASTMVGEGPAIKTFERLQAAVIHDDLDLRRTVVRRAIERGRLPADALRRVLLTAEPPSVQVRDYHKQNIVHSIAHKAGVMSTQTWSSKLGLDYAHEQQNIEEHEKRSAVSDQPDASGPEPTADSRQPTSRLQPPQPDR